MNISIYVDELALPELNHFLTSGVFYQHTIKFHNARVLFSNVEVNISYDEYVALNDLKIESTEESKREKTEYREMTREDADNFFKLSESLFLKEFMEKYGKKQD